MVDYLPEKSIDELRSELSSNDPNKLPPLIDVLNSIEDKNRGSADERRLLIDDLENRDLLTHYGLDADYISEQRRRLSQIVTKKVSPSWKREWNKQ